MWNITKTVLQIPNWSERFLLLLLNAYLTNQHAEIWHCPRKKNNRESTMDHLAPETTLMDRPESETD